MRLFGLKTWRRRRLLRHAQLPEPWWRGARDYAPFLRGLSAEELARLRELAVLFLHEKDIRGVAGFDMTDAKRCTIAAQACLPILNLGFDYYDGWSSVVVYPGQFRARHEYTDEHGVAHATAEDLAGESWDAGPVVLSWEDVIRAGEDAAWGVNLVIHEFAHKLDMLNGAPNGMPPLHRDMRVAEWTQVFMRAYEELCAQVDAGADTPVDEYAAESPGEFFAVVSEAFFTDPERVIGAFPEVYALLRRFYRQDPAARLRAT